MSKAIDYSKWDLIEDNDGIEDNGASDNPPVMFHKFDELKLNADKLFAAAELSRDLYDYKVALNQGYLICLDELEHISRCQRIAGAGIAHSEISCQLNCACCHLRLTEFQRTIDICTSVFTDHQKIMTQDQIIRLRYFRGYSYCKLDLDENLLLAESDAAAMQKILVSLETIHGPFVAEYRDFFQTLHENRQKLLFFDDLIRAESEYFKSNMGNSVQSKKGWILYVQKKFTLSSEWFACKLSDLRKESADNSRDNDLLCDHYCGYGKSQLALNNHIEAAEAFLAASSYTDVTASKINLNLRAASLCFKERDYERAVSSYATALVFAEDSFASENKTDFSTDSTIHAETQLIIALANAGLGMTYVKIKECSRALEHLKAGIGFLTDVIFLKQKLNSSRSIPFTCPDTFMTFTSIEISQNEEEADDNNKKVVNRSLTLPIILSRAQHLLNALESLCDAYAELREWEKAVYTANTSVNVCDGFLEQLQLKDSVTVATMSFTEDGIPIGSLMAHDDSNSNNSNDSNNNNNNNSSRKCTLLFREDVILILHDELCKSELEKKYLDVERINFVSTMRKKRASAIHAKGHMMKKILQYDIRQDNSTEDDMNQCYSGSRPFDSMDTDLSLERFYDTSGYDTTLSGISPAEVITSLWTEAALEYREVEDFEKALLIYMDLATMWEGLGKIKPYCDSLFRIEDVSTPVDTAKQDISDIASNTTALSLSKSVTDNAIPSSDVLQHTIGANKSESELEQRIILPLEPFTAENLKRIHAAQKAKSVWLEAADVASILCLKVISSDDLNGDRKGKDTELFDPSLNIMNEDIILLESQMMLYQQVIQYQFKAGVCALFYDMIEAELLLGRAQTTKEKFQDLAGRLEVAECGRKNVSKTSDVILKNLIKESSSSTRDEAMKVKWLKYNTLCCDISFHLAYTYIRLKKIVYAIAEAEMAIGYAVQLSRSKSKEKRRMCWGVLALAFHASGQVLETERAMNEIHQLQSSNRSDENDDFLESLSTYMLFSKVRKRMHIPESSLIASRYSYSKPVVQEENKSLLEFKSGTYSTSHTSYPSKGNKMKRFYNLLPYQIVVSFLFLLFSFLISFYCYRINAAK